MPDQLAYVLPSPWALMDPNADETGFGRRPLLPDAPTAVTAGRPIYLTSPPNTKVRVAGYRMAAHPIRGEFLLGSDRLELHLLSVGVQTAEKKLDIEFDDKHVGTILINGYVPRPAFSAQKENSATPEIRAENLDIFLLSIVDLIRMANDPQFDDQQIAWDRIEKAWTDRDAESTIPPMALIVRHAEKFKTLIRDLRDRPRHLLRRDRELTPVDRVQQLDVACVRWLSRQPGVDVYERAGPRQRIMAVQRFESIDTLENRVLADYSESANREAIRYTSRYGRLSGSIRWREVFQYGRTCKNAKFDLISKGVTALHQPVVPNFVLLQDQRYRRLWRAYLEIKRERDEEDECWRWQHRLWLDYARILLHLSMRVSHEFKIIAEAPLRVSDEQERGLWVRISSQSATWLYSDDEGVDYVVSLIWSTETEHPKSSEWMIGLGCPAYLHVQRLSDFAEGYIALWAYHGFALDPVNLDDLALSASNAIKNTKSYLQLTKNQSFRMNGIILLSGFLEEKENRSVLPRRPHPTLSGRDEISVLRIGVSFKDREAALKSLANSIKFRIGSLFGARLTDG